MAQAAPGALSRVSDRAFFVANAVVSAAAVAFIAYLLLLRRAAPGGADLSFLPAVNASLNGLSALLLACGWIAIKNRAIRLHRTLMVSAFASSAVFLVCYLVYHYAHGDTKYQGTGAVRLVYFFVLLTHVLLSMAVVPMALTAFYFAWKRQFVRHRRLTRVALPIWLYVSVTGVAIYFMLRAGAALPPS